MLTLKIFSTSLSSDMAKRQWHSANRSAAHRSVHEIPLQFLSFLLTWSHAADGTYEIGFSTRVRFPLKEPYWSRNWKKKKNSKHTTCTNSCSIAELKLLYLAREPVLALGGLFPQKMGPSSLSPCNLTGTCYTEPLCWCLHFLSSQLQAEIRKHWLHVVTKI